MIISRMQAKNWRNFRSFDVELSDTVYLIGPNASGKSNFLDIFRFMRDLVNPNGGGLQQAVKSRGGMKKLRCLAGRQGQGIELEFELKEHEDDAIPAWKYVLAIVTKSGGKNPAVVKREVVYRHGKEIMSRPDSDDENDVERLTETHLQLTNINKSFREIADFFEKTLYLHLVPQLLKHSEMFVSKQTEEDPFGQGFLEKVSATPLKIRSSRLKRTEKILKNVIPHFEELRFEKDEDTGKPHLEMRYVHWRPNAGWQREDQFSDGTLRLIALIWTLMSSDNLILLEEPELSLHRKIVEQIPRMLTNAHRSRRKSGGQIFVSTHSPELLSDTSITGSFLILTPKKHGESTIIETPEAHELMAMKAGMAAADILLPKTNMVVGEL
ncbi:MAG: AAA family ATPase [Pontiellaceae bacterium]|nr:AAA family ATPase [Pontiellaceae bacterium]